MADRIVIREAEASDLPRLRTLFTKSRRETFHWNNRDRYQPSDFDEQTDGEEILVAAVDGEIAGFAAVWTPQSFLHHLYVASEFHGQGVGHALLGSAIDKLTLPVRLKCLVRNVKALSFYQAHGWQRLETGRDDDGEYYLMQLE